MHISCKITLSLLTYIQDNNDDVTPLLDLTSVSDEGLYDPSNWITIDEAEKFLTRATEISSEVQEGMLAFQWIQKVAQAVPQNKSWGVLDSVLRMMPNPMEVFMHAERFVAYFISGHDFIKNISRKDEQIEFDLPYQADEFPLVTHFLISSFACLPLYVHQLAAKTEVKNNRVLINWGQEQNQLFSRSEKDHNLNPQVIRQIINSLNVNPKMSDVKNKSKDKDSKRKLQSQIATDLLLENGINEALIENQTLNTIPSSVSRLSEMQPNQLTNDLSKLADYMVRAQQLITLLVAQDRKTAAVKKAFDIVDWENVVKQFPVIVEKIRQEIMNQELKIEKKLSSSREEALNNFTEQKEKNNYV